MDELKTLTNQLEYIFLKKIISELRGEIMSVEQSKEIATAFLALEPFTSVQEAQKKINTFASENATFKELNAFINAYEEEKKTAQVIDKMKQYIDTNNIDEALQVAKHDK